MCRVAEAGTAIQGNEVSKFDSATLQAPSPTTPTATRPCQGPLEHRAAESAESLRRRGVR